MPLFDMPRSYDNIKKTVLENNVKCGFIKYILYFIAMARFKHYYNIVR